MSEEFDKNEEATPQKLREARDKGQIAKSQEFSGFFGLLAAVSVFIVLGHEMFSTALELLSWWMRNVFYLAMNPEQLNFHFYRTLSLLGNFWLIAAAATVVAVVSVSFIYGGIALSFFPIKPDFSKLNPAKGFKKVFSKRSLVELLKLILKVTFFMTAIYIAIKPVIFSLLNANRLSINVMVIDWKFFLIRVITALLIVFFIFALFDLWFNKKDFAKQMKMSQRDVKDEHKKREGNPEVKAKIKRNQSELLQKLSNVQNVKDADVILVNPTHIAVALKYRPNSMAVPIVLTKGRGMIAKIILRQAKKHQIPVMKNIPLARALERKIKVGAPVSNEEHLAVAKIYNWVVSFPNHKVFSE